MSKTATSLTDLFMLIMQLHPIINPRVSDTNNPVWEYPITQQFDTKYSKSAAQSLLELSYRVGVHNREENDGVKNPLPLNPPNFDVIVPLDTTYMFTKVNVGWFFYSSSMNIAVFAATATYNNILTVVDMNYLQAVPNITNYVPGMKVHGGFLGLYNDVHNDLLSLLSKYVNDKTQIALCGLSLGGAISTIAAIDLYGYELSTGVVIKNVVHYSFASPRLFNVVGAQRYDTLNLNSQQIRNDSDMIPIIPLPVMPASVSSETQDFMHVGNLTEFDRNLGSYYDNHITAYLQEYGITPVG